MSKYFMILKTQFLTCRGEISNARKLKLNQEFTLDNLQNANVLLKIMIVFTLKK